MKSWDGRKCPICKTGRLAPVNDITSDLGGYIFVEKGHRCTYCKEEIIGEGEAEKTIEAAKKLGVWELQMKLERKLTKTARGIILRVPNDVQKGMKLTGNEGIEIHWAKNRLVVDIVR